MSSAEEIFLRNREERERARLAAAGKNTNELYTEQRVTLLKEIEDCESRVQCAIDSDDKKEANASIRELRRLVQDAAATATLTAYEMAKANSTVSRLQDLLLQSGRPDNDHSVTAGPVSSNPSETTGKENLKCEDLGATDTENGKGKKKAKKFRFSAAATKRDAPMSSAPKENNNNNDLEDNSKSRVKTHGESPQGSQVAADGASYGPSSGKDVFIPSARALFLRECENCNVFIVPIAGSAFISGCKSCRIYISCTQLRLKNCVDTEVYAWVASTPIIENCHDMRFGPYTCWRGLLHGPIPVPSHMIATSKPEEPLSGPSVPMRTYTSHRSCVEEVGEILSSAAQDQEQRRGEEGWRWVEDFQWLKKTPSPHWRTLEVSEYQYQDTPFAPLDV